jgi:hypothetical protein
VHCTKMRLLMSVQGLKVTSREHYECPLFIRSRPNRCAALSEATGQSTKSLRDSPLRRVLEPIGW